MASYLRPRRGKQATAISQAIVLKRGEVFFEVPTTGVGTGIGKIKMGDGTTTYASLPYFMEPSDLDDDSTKISFTNTTTPDVDPYTTNPTILGNIIPTNSLKTIFTNLKHLLVNMNSQISTLNTSLTNKADKATTLAGYGITDGVSKAEATATLSSSAWSSGSISVTVAGVTASNDVIVAPGNRDSVTTWCDSKVMCTGQSSNTLTFTCDTSNVPTTDITVNVLILG